ncbi:MAG: IS110 family transposase [Bacilli bacterium]|nr:IS110 family transposase [Bacilli bacterium]
MTFLVGIDIAKYKHDCFIMNHDGEVIRDSFSFSNDRSGFSFLNEILRTLDSSQSLRIGFEATGHYGMNLKIYLEEIGYPYMEFNPLLIRRFSTATTLRRTKTDKVDAQLIALYLSTVDFKPYPPKSYHIRNLKSLSRQRDELIKLRSLQLVQMTNKLDLIFPEFKPFFKHSLKSKTALYLLMNYTIPSKMARMNLDSYNKMRAKLRRTLSYAQFNHLRELAKSTVGNEDDILSFQLELLLKHYDFIQTQIVEVSHLIEMEFAQVASHIQSIPGIGFFSAASIYAEIGMINRFENPDQMLAYAGLEPSRHQSGNSEFKGHMVKHGSSFLRQTLMNVSESSLLHNPVLYDFYKKKRQEGKVHRVALSHVAKKLVRIIFTLETHNIDFDLSKMR